VWVGERAAACDFLEGSARRPTGRTSKKLEGIVRSGGEERTLTETEGAGREEDGRGRTGVSRVRAGGGGLARRGGGIVLGGRARRRRCRELERRKTEEAGDVWEASDAETVCEV